MWSDRTITEETWFFFVKSRAWKKIWIKGHTSAPFRLSRLPPGHTEAHIWHMFRIQLEPFPWQRNRTCHCKTFPFSLLSIRFFTNIADFFAHYSILSTPSTFFKTLRKKEGLNNDQNSPLNRWNQEEMKTDWNEPHTLQCFVELKIQTDFQVNYAMQGHEIISDEIFLLRKWVEQMIPNLDRNANDQ